MIAKDDRGVSVWKSGNDVIGTHLGSVLRMNRMEVGLEESLSGEWFCDALGQCDVHVLEESERMGKSLTLCQ